MVFQVSSNCRISMLANALVQVSGCVPDIICVAQITLKFIDHVLIVDNRGFFSFGERTWLIFLDWKTGLICTPTWYKMKGELGKKSKSRMGFEPTTLHDLVGCCNHWATGDSMVSKGQFVGLDWNRITQLHSQVMTGTHELTNWLHLDTCMLQCDCTMLFVSSCVPVITWLGSHVMRSRKLGEFYCLTYEKCH